MNRIIPIILILVPFSLHIGVEEYTQESVDMLSRKLHVETLKPNQPGLRFIKQVDKPFYFKIYRYSLKSYKKYSTRVNYFGYVTLQQIFNFSSIYRHTSLD